MLEHKCPSNGAEDYLLRRNREINSNDWNYYFASDEALIDFDVDFVVAVEIAAVVVAGPFDYDNDNMDNIL